MELLERVVGHPGPVKVLAKQRRPDDGGDNPRGGGTGCQHHRLGEQ
jgi:hypothetical protein